MVLSPCGTAGEFKRNQLFSDLNRLTRNSDEKNQQDSLKEAFEAKFPGLTLNITVDLSKYHDVNVCTPILPN